MKTQKDNRNKHHLGDTGSERNRIFTSRHAYVFPKLYEHLIRYAFDEAMKGDLDAGQWILDELIIRDREAVKAEYNTLRVNQEWIKDIKKMPCAICGGKADQIDHIKPISRGGTNDRENLQPICKACNSKKSDKQDFTEIRQ